ncbi:DNA-binding response regulator (plasmid) [Bacillus carboniphilus]|uniref:DNA-binding response regulator n=1 Tax=Bacillus carboniphilus TaxID=86663 RepID=A0ABY9JYK4_9BACI|nr:DNA-binding response regulator [Bacillus carboniphilus]WLR44464.1 DNA-binding response regulator [Bacillus carboniphilus]
MNKKEVENILKNYHWMVNSVRNLRSSMLDAGEGLTAQYGIESSMPKPQGTNGDPIYREVLRRENRLGRIENYKEKISEIQDRLHLIKNDREIEVLHWLLEGKSYRWIGHHMGLSEAHIRRMRNSIVNQLANGTNDANVAKDAKLRKQMSAC